jgi:serine/threonine protein kinase
LPIAKQLYSVLSIVLFIGADYKNQLQLISALRGDIDWPGIEQLGSYEELQSSLKQDPQFEKDVIDYKVYIQQSLAIEFIDQLLTLNPKTRININDAMNSPFLKSQSPLALKSLLFNDSRMIEPTVTRMREEGSKQQVPTTWKYPPIDPVY